MLITLPANILKNAPSIAINRTIVLILVNLQLKSSFFSEFLPIIREGLPTKFSKFFPQRKERFY